LQAELFVLLADTFKRMKVTETFKRDYCKVREIHCDLLDEMFTSTSL